MAREIISISTQNGGPADLFGAMGMYNELAKFGDVDVTFRGLTGNILVLADATYYLWAYVAAQNLCALKRKVNVPAFVLMFLLVVSSMLTGSRSELLMRGAAFLFMVLHFTYRRHAELKSDPTAKIALAVVIVLIVGFLGFQPLLKLTGRGASKLAPFEHISKYLGAPMKNLDMYLNDELRRPIKVESERWGEQTLAIAYVSIDHWTGQEPEIKWKDWQPFQKVKRVNLGNVYTIYYPFVFDWGYAGALVAITAMGAICEAVYLLSYTRRILWKGLIKTSVIVYGVMGYGLIFCFFHNFIVNAIVASGFVRMAAIWIVASVLAARVSKQDDAVAIEK